jgi:hypothetical protein
LRVRSAFRDERATSRDAHSIASPPIRPRLIAEALAFVRAARDLAGVTRIALIGSLATAKADPKDIDLLVTVAEDADLGDLAALGRRMRGRAQSLNRGAEVFLADARGTYLGRLCTWRRCRPGIRLGCDALHCGRRHYLHDDLATIRLARSLVATPPVDVWPYVVARVPLPEDVVEGLVAPLGSIMREDGE